MKYWLTTHWPPRIDEDKFEIHEGVYAPEGRQRAIEKMKEKDLLFIYETKNGRPEKRQLLNGEIQTIPCHEGREGIVVLARILSDVYEIENAKATEYYDGSKVLWRYCADTGTINSHGYVDRIKVALIILGQEN